jgi:dipeptidyl aminopeptidase/acylaminoacyl peptidase
MVVGYEHSQKMAAALKKAEGEVKFTTYEDVDHNSWENAFVEPELLPWLFSHSLE